MWKRCSRLLCVKTCVSYSPPSELPCSSSLEVRVFEIELLLRDFGPLIVGKTRRTAPKRRNCGLFSSVCQAVRSYSLARKGSLGGLRRFQFQDEVHWMRGPKVHGSRHSP